MKSASLWNVVILLGVALNVFAQVCDPVCDETRSVCEFTGLGVAIDGPVAYDLENAFVADDVLVTNAFSDGCADCLSNKAYKFTASTSHDPPSLYQIPFTGWAHTYMFWMKWEHTSSGFIMIGAENTDGVGDFWVTHVNTGSIWMRDRGDDGVVVWVQVLGIQDNEWVHFAFQTGGMMRYYKDGVMGSEKSVPGLHDQSGHMNIKYMDSDSPSVSQNVAIADVSIHTGILSGTEIAKAAIGRMYDMSNFLDLSTLPTGPFPALSGNYRATNCRCFTGYYALAPIEYHGICFDTNECLNGDHNCDPDATCENKNGYFICTCNSGYTGSG
eukprot:3938931-Rhodomonas_salina.1